MNCRVHYRTSDLQGSESIGQKAPLQSSAQDEALEIKRAVQSLQQLIHHHIPSMVIDVRCGAGNELTTNDIARKQVSQLYQAIQQSEPDAGRFYWSAQSWNMLCWQPVMLSVVAAMQFQLVVDVRQMRQNLQGAGVAGLSLPESAFTLDQQDDAKTHGKVIIASAVLLRKLFDTLIEQISGLFPINQNLAKRLFADRLLSTLLLLQRLNNGGEYSEASNQQTASLANLWLEAANLQGASGLMQLDVHSGTHRQSVKRLALNRKGCCQHFRKSDGKVCVNCPKNKMPERIRLIQQSWLNAAV